MGEYNRFLYDYFGGNHERNVAQEDVAEEHRFRVTHQVNIRFELRDAANPFAISVGEFLRLYRIPQHLVLRLVGILAPYMVEGTRNHFVPLEIKVLCALSFYAHGSYQRPTGRLSDLSVSQSMASVCIDEVTNALNQPGILLRFIHFPSTQAQREEVILRNFRFGLPRVLGYADGTLVKIVPPPRKENQQSYRCRKGFTALNVHIVCDADLMILTINAQYPGSCPDPFIYRYSGLRDTMIAAYRESRCWLLGDSAYPEEPWLHTPILHAERGTPEFEYTETHCKGRNCIERLNGVLKNRWRCLLSDRTLHYHPVKAGLIVNACAVLHNFCREQNVPDPPPLRNRRNDDDRENDGVEEFEVVEQPRALRLQALRERQYLIDYVQAQRAGEM